MITTGRLAYLFSLLGFLSLTQAAVIGHHADLVRKPLLHKNLSQMVHAPPSFHVLKRHLSRKPEAKTNHKGLVQAEHRQPELQKSHSFMMITATTGSSSFADKLDAEANLPTRPGLADQDPNVVSFEMTIIEFGDDAPFKRPRVPKLFGLPGPLSIGKQAVFPSGNEEAMKMSMLLDSFQGSSSERQTSSNNPTSLSNSMGLPVENSPPSKVESVAATARTAKPSGSFPRPTAGKASESISFSKAPEEQIVFSTKTKFDNTSHHSQL
ncbi:hypothetical protein O181_021110 [Austropuccinia psidii MF-1]|uniref:Uncharacterized protein n=1 Tax=Austropuccinia psidii MF-1 TaxID=1389203 RepID=A0A9Q3CF35_9BASI|nr:hypothetical protein [Austropuccinia psidii MF-1]